MPKPKRPRLVPIGRLPRHILRGVDNRLRRDGLAAAASIQEALAGYGYRVTATELAERKSLIDYLHERMSSTLPSPPVFENETARDWAAEFVMLEMAKRGIEDRQRALWDRLLQEQEAYESCWRWMLGSDEPDRSDQAGKGYYHPVNHGETTDETDENP